MKIGLISDVHGHLAALQKALALLDEKEVDQILCAGDLVDGETEADSVIRLLRERDIPCVQGNHDRDAFADQAWRQRRGVESPFGLQAESIGFLMVQPIMRVLELAGRQIILAHGTPWDNITYVYPESYDVLRRLAQELDASIIILGHTHAPMHIQIRDQHIYNPGSVYGNRFMGNKQSCAILDLDDLTYTVYELSSRESLIYETETYSSADKIPRKSLW